MNFINWTKLANLGNLKVMKLTSFIPFFGYLLLYNDQANTFFNNLFSEYEQFHLSCIFLSELSCTVAIETSDTDSSNTLWSLPSNITFLYFGSVLLGIGSIVFNLFCPELLKIFSNDKEHIEFEKGCISEIRASDLVSRNHHFVQKFGTEDEKNTFISLERSLDNWSTIDQDRFIGELIFLVRKNSALSYKYLRLLVSLLFFLGLILISIPSIKTFIFVLIATLS